MVRFARRTGWRPTGRGDAVELAAAARGGDGSAVEAFERGGRILGAMIANCAATCDLRRVIVGGGGAQGGGLLMAPLRRSVARHARLPFTARPGGGPAPVGPAPRPGRGAGPGLPPQA